MMRRVPAGANFSFLMVVVGGLIVAVWALSAIDRRAYLPLSIALGMVTVVLISGAIGVWLHARLRQLSGLPVSLLAALFLAPLSMTLLANFSVILLALALLLVIAGVISLSRDASRC